MTAALLFYSAESVSQHNFLRRRNLKKQISDFLFKSSTRDCVFQLEGNSIRDRVFIGASFFKILVSLL